MLVIFKVTDKSLSLSDLIILIILYFIFAIASPPCACAGMVAYTILFQVFQMDMSYLPFAVAIDTLVDYFNSGLTVFGKYVCVLLIDKKRRIFHK